MTENESYPIDPTKVDLSDVSKLTEISRNESSGNSIAANYFDKNTKFEDECFTTASQLTMKDFLESNDAMLHFDDILKTQDPTKPFNITRWNPMAYSVVVLALSKVSPLLLTGIKDADKDGTKTTYWIVGVNQVEDNYLFGKQITIPLRVFEQANQINFPIDPYHGGNVKKTYMDMKKEILEANKGVDKTDIKPVVIRSIFIASIGDILAYTV